MNRCRNCAALEVVDLGFVGKLAPFFLKRVFGMKLGFATSPGSLKQLLRRIALVPQRWLERITRPAALIEMQLCSRCTFIQSKLPFDEYAINRLYLDYRSDSYNMERSEYEPGYAAIAAQVGQDPAELDNRITAATKFLATHIPSTSDFTILDYGGADGKFLPRIDARKFVYEISNIEPIAGVSRVHALSDLDTYSLVQLTHVIEHVVEPLQLVQQVAAHVAHGGYLYLETPQELSEEQRSELTTGRRVMPVHEHINSYSALAVSMLIEAAGLDLVGIEASPVDVGWGKAVHIRALGRKPAARSA